MESRTDQSVSSLLAEEADAIDEDRDAPITEKSTVTRGHRRSKVLQIRLNDEELAELERLAETRGLPASTVAREAILRQLHPEVARETEATRLINQFAQFVLEFGCDTPASDSRPDFVATTSPGGQIVVETKGGVHRSAVSGVFVTESTVRAGKSKRVTTLRDAKTGRKSKTDRVK
ncbi:CopG family transcriptional regulator [Mycobacterium sp. pV006]|uniref:CopG family transcriptional regulator n=1 Tax=Mycobacterium sp. pV006 TaxID=3238983 RepID=UPI00351AEE96